MCFATMRQIIGNPLQAAGYSSYRLWNTSAQAGSDGETPSFLPLTGAFTVEEKLRFLRNRLKEKLWVKPLIFCVLSVIAALLARLADTVSADVANIIPDITRESIESLLKITAASMLVIATFSVSSMVAAYASAANTATPRSFALIIADDVSQNALSTFIGVFIFSVVALVALMNGYYGKPGRFVLFALTLLTLGLVIVTFIRWVDKIARLGRLGTIIDKVESATAQAMRDRLAFPSLRGLPTAMAETRTTAVYAETIGYVQQVDIRKLQRVADDLRARIKVTALPGTFATPDRPIAHVLLDDHSEYVQEGKQIESAFTIGHDRLFEEDPRFGLIVLSEIASRALSPAVNDPGTAIDVIGTYVRLFIQWSSPLETQHEPECDRVHVPEISIGDMFDDAFTPVARDGAAMLEVQVRLQKALKTLAALGNESMHREAVRHARSALERVETAMDLPADIEAIRRAGNFT